MSTWDTVGSIFMIAFTALILGIPVLIVYSIVRKITSAQRHAEITRQLNTPPSTASPPVEKMRVTFTRKYGKVGWVLTNYYHQLELSIAFSQEALAAIEIANLAGYTVLQRPEYQLAYGKNSAVWPVYSNFKVHDLVRIHESGKPEVIFYAPDQPDVAKAEDELRENLKRLRSQIQAVTTKKSNTETFEL